MLICLFTEIKSILNCRSTVLFQFGITFARA